MQHRLSPQPLGTSLPLRLPRTNRNACLGQRAAMLAQSLRSCSFSLVSIRRLQVCDPIPQSGDIDPAPGSLILTGIRRPTRASSQAPCCSDALLLLRRPRSAAPSEEFVGGRAIRPSSDIGPSCMGFGAIGDTLACPGDGALAAPTGSRSTVRRSEIVSSG